MEATDFQVAIGGEAGQGLVTIGETLTRALVRSGYHVAVTQDYMSRIRGGHNVFCIRASTRPVRAPQRAIDLLIALDARSVELHGSAVEQADGVVVLPGAACETGARGLRVPYSELADRRHVDMVALGVAAALLGLERPLLETIVSTRFETKDTATAQSNRLALVSGYDWVLHSAEAFYAMIPPTHATSASLMLNGNEALALGAMAAGVRFCAFYPMTPATSVVLHLAKHADAMGIAIEQAEDEIAAINMALGASFAGSRSMTATSGGGFALMAEGVSLAGAAELPVVIVVAQRPGPATGLPTRTEQSDLEFVLHAGHGEFPRAILTPGSVESCFHLMRRAFVLAEASRGPVFVLTDQYLADAYCDVPPFDLEAAPPLAKAEPEVASEPPYLPYAIAPSGVSPHRHPCAGCDLAIADSHEHAEDGHITEDAATRTRMVDKRLRKAAILAEAAVPPEYCGSDVPELLLVSWGSSKGAVTEAAQRIGARVSRVATLHFDQVWPLVPSLFLGRLTAARETVCVEGNATQQFAKLIRRETGFLFSSTIGRYDGRPITPEYIMERLGHA